MDLKRVEQLIELMRRSGVTQLCLELPDYKISIKRGPEGEGSHPIPGETAKTEKPGVSPQAPPEAERQVAPAMPVLSPVVGVFHNGGMVTPREIVREGDRVQKGQLLAAIEAMKVPNELRAPVSGVVSKLLVRDGDPVEYGQELFLIEPEEGGDNDGEALVGLA